MFEGQPLNTRPFPIKTRVSLGSIVHRWHTLQWSACTCRIGFKTTPFRIFWIRANGELKELDIQQITNYIEDVKTLSTKRGDQFTAGHFFFKSLVFLNPGSFDFHFFSFFHETRVFLKEEFVFLRANWTKKHVIVAHSVLRFFFCFEIPIAFALEYIGVRGLWATAAAQPLAVDLLSTMRARSNCWASTREH